MLISLSYSICCSDRRRSHPSLPHHGGYHVGRVEWDIRIFIKLKARFLSQNGGAHIQQGITPGVSFNRVLRKRIVKYGKGFNKAIF